jgi:hypothetical protein
VDGSGRTYDGGPAPTDRPTVMQYEVDYRWHYRVSVVPFFFPG